ncbi:VOC family protein [Streptomyces aidingensis]|uniref:VOC domain-containing protein n=1 Tax=Streptomyces aidingensis TaxID=910347 RepID=A0A1I1SFY8_9ACTN|nr:VOC family protein [Streptomyces aidingensis]SFD45389.1 hypothetical protein SAMN05421773_11615 [Streptomyces aidingensis]
MSLTAHDLKDIQGFYANVLGWEYEPALDGLGGGYAVARSVDGAQVAGLGTTGETKGLPAAWTAHFVADSVDVVASRIRERGATVAVGPIDFGDGRAAWAADPGGASFVVWEGPVDPAWYERRGQGTCTWLELRTRDPFDSALFYGGVFDWEAQGPENLDVRYQHDRVVLWIAGRAVAGLYGGGVQAAPDPHLRPQWHVYFSVGDVDEAALRAEKAHGTVVTAPHDTPFGRAAGIRDPEGGLFHVIADHP